MWVWIISGSFFKNQRFLDAVAHNLFLVFPSAALLIVIPFFIAVVLQGKALEKTLFYTGYYMPYVISSVAVRNFFMYFLKWGWYQPVRLVLVEKHQPVYQY